MVFFPGKMIYLPHVVERGFQGGLKEHVALDRSSWSLKAYVTVCYVMNYD